MLDVQIQSDSIRFGKHFVISFKRTLRIPDDGKPHKAPPNFGVFPIYRVLDHPTSISVPYMEDGAFIPMYQREALYIRFENEAPWQPHAVKVALGGINAISGKTHTNTLHQDPQDYLVCPPQLWLDGINTGHDTIRQFLAMPLGLGYTIEASLTGSERVGGLQITVFAPKPGLFPDTAPEKKAEIRPTAFSRQNDQAAQMGLGAGGEIKQKILPDPHGIETWDQNNFAEVAVHILNSAQFQLLTGHEPPATSVDEETYTEHKFPWFPLYGETMQGDVRPPDLLSEAKTVAERDAERNQNERSSNR